MNELSFHPVEWYNIHGVFKDIFKNEKEGVFNLKSDKEVCYFNPENLNEGLNNTTYQLLPSNQISVLRNNPHRIASGLIIFKFTLLSIIKFKGDFRAAESYVMYKLMNMNTDFVEVGCDYYKIISKENRYGGNDKNLKAWKKDSITEHHTKSILKIIPHYDDFCIRPDNINYSPVYKNCYNLYSEFTHHPVKDKVTVSEIPTTIHLIKHIFGDEKFYLGLRYFKLLYEYPMQILPILVLISEERETGKTTFLNYISMLFGDNSVLINPSDLISSFNSNYATKNIILIDEAFVEKGLGIEKLKSIATAKKMSVNPKHVQGYSVDFFGKVIMCSNKELDFMRIDAEEIRFFVRKIKAVTGQRNVNIEIDLFNEIPKFLKYLTDMPAIDFSKSRMVFTKEEIITDELLKVKKNSRITLIKDIEIRIRELFFEKSSEDIIYATAGNIHDRWWKSSSSISPSYIKRILDEDFKLEEPKQVWYFPLANGTKVKNRPYKFERTKFLSKAEIEEIQSQSMSEI